MVELSQFTNGGYLATHQGKAFVRAIGTGPPIVVVHGGPGLDHTYLVKWLQPLTQQRTIIYYDQTGCGSDRTPMIDVSFQRTVEQFEALIDALGLGESYGLFTHSWGSNVVLSAILQFSSIKPSEITFCSPTALTRQRFDESGERLLKRIPKDAMELIGRLEASEEKDAGVRLMNAALPYYVASSEVPEIEFGFYSSAVFSRVIESVGDFDFTLAAQALPRRSLLIYGESDFEIPDGTRELHEAGLRSVCIERTGHFPFAERPEEFMRLVRGAL